MCCVWRFSVVCELLNNGGQQNHLMYSFQDLLLLQTVCDTLPPGFHDFPSDIKVTNNSRCDRKTRSRRRGCRSGVKRRLRKNKTRPPLPSMTLANTRSIRPGVRNTNFDELTANVRYMTEYRDSCILCLTETWLCDSVTDDSVAINGFGAPLRTDRDTQASGKNQGGGVCLYVNERWCNRACVTVRKQLCTRDVELLSVSICPTYLPREFGQIFVTVCYVPPSAHSARAASEIAETVRSLQLISPDAPCFVLGDFNDCDLRTCLPAFEQYVTCPTRKDKTLDRAMVMFVMPTSQLPFLLMDHQTIALCTSCQLTDQKFKQILLWKRV